MANGSVACQLVDRETILNCLQQIHNLSWRLGIIQVPLEAFEYLSCIGSCAHALIILILVPFAKKDAIIISLKQNNFQAQPSYIALLIYKVSLFIFLGIRRFLNYNYNVF